MISAQDPNEPLPVVDEHDQPLGVRPRQVIHRDGLRHRAVHILLFDPEGRLYLQRRSQAKDTHPGQWTSSASGHVDPGEEYEAAAHRELAEELGLRASLVFLGKIGASAATGQEFSAVYRAESAQEPRPNPVEISEGRFFSQDDALALAADAERAVPALALVLALAWPASS